MKWKLLFIVIVLLVVVAVGVIVYKREGEKPAAEIHLSKTEVGALTRIPIKITDKKSGIQNVRVKVIQNGKETPVLERDFPRKSLLAGGEVRFETIAFDFEPKKFDLRDGKATLRVVARDYSWSDMGNGNRTTVEKELVVDTRPPEIDILSPIAYLNQGGAGITVYRLSEPCEKSGVYVGENFFSGYPGFFENENILLSFYGINYDQGPGTDVYVSAVDKAGNDRRVGFQHRIKRKKFKNDTINIGDNFLNWKMAEFDVSPPSGANNPKLAKFLRVNGKLREENYEKFKEIAQNTDNRIYWEGPFLRLTNSARMANYADHRKYIYNGDIVDRQVHLGIDLASVKNAEIPASNTGKVAFAGTIGIYGKTVMIDHVFGLYTTYSHLSAIRVSEGQMVKKGEIIGNTGKTGMAGGDHLHFGVFLQNIFINPIEWWDGSWIENNVTAKLEMLKEEFLVKSKPDSQS